jgi:SAM-dependent methyltransferase
VAAGAGGQTLAAARRAGPDGHVLATDISGNILAFAERSAREAGLRNVETRVVDGEELDVPPGAFDAVISRVGFIYFPDQHAAFAGMRRALRPGGRLAGIVYSTPDANPFFSIAEFVRFARESFGALQAERSRARGGVERDRARALALRDGGRLRGPLRAARRRGYRSRVVTAVPGAGPAPGRLRAVTQAMRMASLPWVWVVPMAWRASAALSSS